MVSDVALLAEGLDRGLGGGGCKAGGKRAQRGRGCRLSGLRRLRGPEHPRAGSFRVFEAVFRCSGCWLPVRASPCGGSSLVARAVGHVGTGSSGPWAHWWQPQGSRAQGQSLRLTNLAAL